MKYPGIFLKGRHFAGPSRVRVSRAIERVSVYASSFWLYSAVVFCERFISLEVIYSNLNVILT